MEKTDIKSKHSNMEKMITKSKLSNFWFYYRWHTFAAIFVVFVLSVCITQCSQNDDADYTIGLYLNATVSTENSEKVKQEILKNAVDINNDGKIVVDMYDFSYNESEKSNQIGDSKLTKLQAEIFGGTTLIYIVDDYTIKSFEEDDLLQTRDIFPDKNSTALTVTKGPIGQALQGVTYTGDIHLILRNVDSTAIESIEGTKDREQAALEIIQKITGQNK